MTAPRETAGALERFVASMRHAMLCPRSDGYEKVKPCICERGKLEAALAALRSSADRAEKLERLVVWIASNCRRDEEYDWRLTDIVLDLSMPTELRALWKSAAKAASEVKHG